LKTTYRNDFDIFEEKIKNSLNELKEINVNYSVSLYNKLELNLTNIEKELTFDTNKIKNSLKGIDEYMNVSNF
jgi:hypothetical protein